MSIIQFCNKKFKSPLLNASGNWVSEDYQVRDLNDDPDVAGIVLKTCSMNPKRGNPWPNFIMGQYYAINNMGLPNNGFAYYSKMFQIYRNKPVILSIDGSLIDDTVFMLKSYSAILKVETGIVEINLSCPNLKEKAVAGKPVAISRKLLTGFLDYLTTYLLQSTQSTQNLQIGLKLPPYFYEYKIKQIAELLNQYPIIRFITCCNTIPNALFPASDDSGKEIIGGLSGSAVNKAIALSNVKLFRKYLKPEIEIIGCGGIESARDVADYLKCGAKLVQIGTAFIKDKNVFREIAAKL